MKPDFAEAHNNLGEVLLDNGHHREGLNEKLIGAGAICFDLNNGLIILWEVFDGKGNSTNTKFDSYFYWFMDNESSLNMWWVNCLFWIA